MPGSQTSKLQSADQTAQQSGNSAPAPVVSCPLLKRHALEVCVVGENGQPIADIAIALHQSDTAALQDKSDNSGLVRFEKLVEGSYSIRLPKLDKDAWESTTTEVLQLSLSPEGDAAWQSPAATAPGFTHTVVQGECTAKLAERFGFFADTLWQLPDNDALKTQRKEMNILFPGDSLHIPALRDKSIAVSTGNRYVIKRKGVPDVFRVRFMINGVPRVNVEYLASMSYIDGKIAADCKGVTDQDGFVVLTTSPSIKTAKIIIGSGDQRETHNFNIGYIDPLELPSGIKARLSSLGYFTGDGQGSEAEQLQQALRYFQGANELAVTGEADADTLGKLREKYLS